MIFYPKDKISINELTPDLQNLVQHGDGTLDLIIDNHILNENIHITNTERSYWNKKAELASPIFTGIPTVPTAAQGNYTNQIATTLFIKNELDAYTPLNANTATKLETPRTISLSGSAVSGAVLFDGSVNISIPVYNVMTAALVGTIDKTNLTGAYNIDITGTAAVAVKAMLLNERPGTDYALVVSPSFDGVPMAPTPTLGDNSTKIATTEFINSSIALAMANLKIDGVPASDSLSTPRTFKITGKATSGSVLFDGTNDVNLIISDIDGTGVSGVNAVTVNGHTVLSDVPVGATFTDTVYIHPTTNINLSGIQYLVVEVDDKGHVINGYNPTFLNIDITGVAAKAIRLQATRNIGLSGAIVASSTFNGNADCIIDVSAIDPSYLTQTENYRTVSDIEKTSYLDKYTKAEIDSKFSQVASGLDWRESVATFSSLATTYPSPEDGWTVNVKDDDITYRYTGTTWVPISSNSIPMASTTLSGKMSNEMVIKLNGIATNANNYVHPSTHAATMITGLSTVATSGSYADLLNKPTSMIANGGNSATVNNHTVLTDVPANALFTDTVYTHPATHPASIIVQDISNRFVSDIEKAAWNAKAETVAATTASNGLMSAAMVTKLNGIDTNANKYIHPASGIAYGTYRSLTIDNYGHAIAGTNPTTLSGYGITTIDPAVLKCSNSSFISVYDVLNISYYNTTSVTGIIKLNLPVSIGNMSAIVEFDIYDVESSLYSKIIIDFTIVDGLITKSNMSALGGFNKTIKLGAVYVTGTTANITIAIGDITTVWKNTIISVSKATAIGTDKDLLDNTWSYTIGNVVLNSPYITLTQNTTSTVENARTSLECTGNSATATSAAALIKGNWVIDVDASGNLIFINNSNTRFTFTPSGEITANTINEN